MDFEKIKAIVAGTDGLTGWCLRRRETQSTTLIHLPGIYKVEAGKFARQRNPHPREVITAPSEEIWVTVYCHPRRDMTGMSDIPDRVPSATGEAVGQFVSDDEAAVKETLAGLVAAALAQPNRPYPLVDKSAVFPQVDLAERELLELSQPALQARLQRFADAVLPASESELGIELSNLEVFVRRMRNHVETGTGIIIDYPSTLTDAELCFIARFGDKVAEHTSRPHARRLRDLDPQVLVTIGADYARGTANASAPPQWAGPVVLTGTAAHDFMKLDYQPLSWHCGGRAIYEKMSRYAKGRPAWGQKSLAGDAVTIFSDPLVPFGPDSHLESDAQPARRTCLLKDGCYDEVIGGPRYYHYLGLLEQDMTPSGPPGNTVVPAGRHRTCDLLGTGRAVVIRGFSDFRADPTSGDFASEIRLGEVREDGNAKPFKGGLLIGNWFDALADIRLSSETVGQDGYYGPAAIRVGDLKVAS
ncbi:MAG TPA: metallopeptidase TldD-related protein [bacterium]|nr:metallopeptidase TldD-related protein [bacterium]